MLVYNPLLFKALYEILYEIQEIFRRLLGSKYKLIDFKINLFSFLNFIRNSEFRLRV